MPTGSSSHSTEKWSYLSHRRGCSAPTPSSRRWHRSLHQDGTEKHLQSWLLPLEAPLALGCAGPPAAQPGSMLCGRHPEILRVGLCE